MRSACLRHHHWCGKPPTALAQFGYVSLTHGSVRGLMRSKLCGATTGTPALNLCAHQDSQPVSHLLVYFLCTEEPLTRGAPHKTSTAVAVVQRTPTGHHDTKQERKKQPNRTHTLTRTSAATTSDNIHRSRASTGEHRKLYLSVPKLRRFTPIMPDTNSISLCLFSPSRSLLCSDSPA